MRIINGPVQDGTAGKAGSQFSGTAFPYLTMAATDGVTINTVNFTPGARTYWHHHENGQILQVLAPGVKLTVLMVTPSVAAMVR